MDKKEELEKIKKRVHQSSIYMSDVTSDTKTRFLAFAEKEFKGHFGFALKWLMDFRDGILTTPTQAIQDEFAMINHRLEKLEEAITIIGKQNKQEEPDTSIRMVSGRKLNESNEVKKK